MENTPISYKKAELKNGKVNILEINITEEKLTQNTVLIKIDYVGICRADIKEVIGSRDIPTDRGPLFGHELIGSVVFSGEESGFKLGELVTLNPNITPNRTTGFAEYILVHDNKENLDQTIIRVPESEILDHIWMPEPFACIVHATDKLVELANLPTNLEGQKIGIIGAGCSGLMFSMYFKYLGASVVVFNRGEMRRNFAINQNILPESEIYLLDQIDNFKNHFDIVIVVPTRVTTSILEKAAYIAKDNGILHIYGGTRAGDKFLDSDLNIDVIRRQEKIGHVVNSGKNLFIAGAYGCYKKDYEVSFKLHTDYPDYFPLGKIISKEISLNELSELMHDMAIEAQDFPGKILVNTRKSLLRV